MEEKKISLQNIVELHRLVSLYQESLDKLMEKESLDKLIVRFRVYWWRKEKRSRLWNHIIMILHLRDEIEQLRGLSDNQKFNDFYHDIVIQDIKLKRISGLVATSPNFTEIRDLIKPAIEKWWWYPVHPMNQFDPFLGVFSVLCLIGALALAIDLIPRFFAGGPNLLGGLAVILMPLTSWFFGKEALEKAPQSKATLEKAMAALNVPLIWRQEVVAVLSLLFVMSAGYFYRSKAEISRQYYCSGLEELQNKTIGRVEYDKMYKGKKCDGSKNYIFFEVATPKSKLDVAAAMHPSDPDVHFLLGRIYELRQDLDLARTEYKLAMDSGHQKARIRIVLLYLLEDQEKTANIAASILMQAEAFNREPDKEHRKSLYTLRAWARYSQGRYSDAISDLNEAEKLFPIINPIYREKNEQQPALFNCIKATTLEKQKQYADADHYWNECKKVTNSADPEDDFWKTKRSKCVNDENKKSRREGKSICLEKEKKDN